MSNIIQFRAQRQDVDASIERCDRSSGIEPGALRVSARNALSRLAGQFELAIEHAHEVEPRIRDPEKRREFSDQIKRTRRLLEIVHLKILQI
ncbi:hypothetical protein JQ612_15645 [Bradyrhizobium manausense]|uniref:hypothetical protein n=1 Tax=Bradyrhizobium manausense TaxID=989370 RepID=UPI001BA72DBF|nr:hypothetical protein [Bradyrhizobium manausense]MBR0684775.1 hypothetical protein [Bradyrhizobium manausense]MBR0725640.1 hypothetical protein [Bradyrhizobium manausense]MBR0834621.1 hypothetical protein [Bradyrhizobium manausense]